MFVFSSLVATVTFDPGAIRRMLFAIALVSAFLALYLVFNYYGSVSIGVTGYREAGRLRSQALEGMSLETGLNILGYTVGMGAVVALAQLLGTSDRRARIFWGTIYVICAIGSFVPLSRGAFVALICASLLVLSRNFAKLIKPEVAVLFVGIVVLVISLMPPALTERYSALMPGPTVARQKTDGRLNLLRLALDPISDYWEVGVGAGNYWERWAVQNGLGRWMANGRPAVLGPHNAFLAAWIYFGLPGLVLLCVICLSAFRACFKARTASPESAALLGMLGLVIVWLMFTHSLYLKLFGVVIGLIVGVSQQRQWESTRRKPIALRRRFALRQAAYAPAAKYERAPRSAGLQA